MDRVHRALWIAGWPARSVLIAAIQLYRITIGPAVGGGCRFHPTCSAYAVEAIRNTGALRGSVLAGWRVLRCSPLTRGGIDRPPRPLGRPFLYEVLRGTGRGPAGRLYDDVISSGREAAR